MTTYLATITVELFIEVDPNQDVKAQAIDAANEILREQQRHWVSTSSLLDYTIGAVTHKVLELGGEPYKEDDWMNAVEVLQ